ncbi:hypothetical protein M0R45_032114 [Rubus argutus]|uniref:GBF-interacting protein 1 N-terminal domain-containing protein n=1 Tax=Rubus argutus TaxID=59490 RepID=A0AAW1WGS3_RUBAR
MVSGSRIEGGTQIISAGVRKTIQSIKEIVGNHSDIDIYWALKETDMDPNETAQKLLNQDPFHEVKRKRDKKKEVSPKSVGPKVLTEPRRHFESAGQGPRSNDISDRNVEPRRHFESAGQGPRSNTISDRNGEPKRHFESAGQGPRSNTISDRNLEPRRHFESAGQGPRSNAISDRNVEPKRHFESAGQGPRSNTVSDRNVEPRRHFESAGQGPKSNTFSDRNVEPRRHFESAGQGPRLNSFSDRNVRRGGFVRRGLPGISKEFRVVRDNRANQNMDREMKPASLHATTSTNEQLIPNVSEKGQTGSSSSQKPSNRQNSLQALNGQTDSRIRTSDANSTGSIRKETLVEKRVSLPNSASRVQAGKPNNSQPHSASSTSVIGVYSSSTDPVHVPSPDSRPSASVGAIKREVGVVGVRKQSSDPSKSSVPSSSFSNSLLGKEGSTESYRSFTGISKTDQLSQTSESVMPIIPVNRSFISNQHNVRPHQQPVGHQKASQPNKEWKPKSSQKPSSNSPGVIGTPTKSASPPADDSKFSESEAAKLQDKLARVNVYDNCNVVIAQNIRVPESDRFQLTFGSLGTEFDSKGNTVNGFQAGATEELNREPPASLSSSAPELRSDEASGTKSVDLLDDHVRNSGSDFPAPSAVLEHQLPEKKETSSPQSVDNYADIGLVRDNSPSFAPSDSQHQDPPELQGFTAFDPQTGYDIPYYRPTMDESVRGQGLPSPQEALSSHTANSIPASTVAMVQQQPPHVAQMYPQVHVSHYANLMPYRQYISPVYVPPMAVPGYSNNPAYPHMSNGNSYLLMPGGGSHLNANSLKYGVQQFKPVPAGSPTGFGNFTNPAGYAMNAPGVVGGATGLEDSSRMKYKDGNLYVPNPQAETSEIWIQNPRDHPGMQSTPYYNMPGQTPHAAYMPSHAGHASFNAAAAQSSHMQFPGMYHPPQPAAMASPHHMGPAMPGNVGVGVAAAAPGAQAYQQSQLNHMNWTTNF